MGNERTAPASVAEKAEGTARDTEAERVETGATGSSRGRKGGFETPTIDLREVQTRDVDFVRTCSFDEAAGLDRHTKYGAERDYRETGGRKNGGGSRSSASKAAIPDSELVIVGEVCWWCYSRQKWHRDTFACQSCSLARAVHNDRRISSRSTSGVEPCSSKFGAYNEAHDHGTQDTQQSCQYKARSGYAGRSCRTKSDDFTYHNGTSPGPRITKPAVIPVSRGNLGCYQKHTCAPGHGSGGDRFNTFGSEHNSGGFCRQLDLIGRPGAYISRQFGPRERCVSGDSRGQRSSQTKEASKALAPESHSPFCLDGSSEAEAKTRQTGIVERRPSQRVGQVANKVRDWELKSAIPMPHHWQPAGHYRHTKETSRRARGPRHEAPTVQLVFPLHVHRFPRRTSTGSPYRPETPLHRSMPEDEPYIHSPQPSRSMPMLKDPPEPEHIPEHLDTSSNNYDSRPPIPSNARLASKSFTIRQP